MKEHDMPRTLPPQNDESTMDEITMLTRLNNVPLSSEFYDGIRTNLTLLRHYTQLVETMPLPDPNDPAFEYTP